MKGLRRNDRAEQFGWRTAAVAMVLIFSGAANAFELRAMEYRSSGYDGLIQELLFKEILGYDQSGKPVLLLDPTKARPDQAFIEILKPGIPIDRKDIQDQIAKSLAAFPKQCHSRTTIDLVVNPVSNLDRWLPGVKDKRRINSVNIYGCLEETPIECMYTMTDNGAFDYDIGSLKKRLVICSDALFRGIKSGSPYSDYKAHNKN